VLGGLLFGEIIVNKSINYTNLTSSNTSWKDIIKPLLFLVASLIYAKNKTKIIYIFLPLIRAAFIVGDSRVNIFCFFVFLYAALPVKKGLNLGILVTSIYFLLKNYFFLAQVFKYGNGFYL
jgi:hypothetical protein